MRTLLVLLACLLLPTTAWATAPPADRVEASSDESAGLELRWLPGERRGAGDGLADAAVASPALTLFAFIEPLKVAGLGLFGSGLPPYFRAQREAQGPGLHIPGPQPR